MGLLRLISDQFSNLKRVALVLEDYVTTRLNW